MSTYCTLQGENIPTQLSRAIVDTGETDLSGWLNLVEGASNPNNLLANNERRVLYSFFGSTSIQINSVATVRPSWTCFNSYALFYVKMGGILYVFHHREGNTIVINRVERTVYHQFGRNHKYTENELDQRIIAGFLRQIAPDQIGSYLSSRWPPQYTRIFSYLFEAIPVVLLWSRGVFWYGIHQQTEIGTEIINLKIMNFNHICRLIEGFSNRRFVLFESENVFALSKCSICLERKLCSSLCGQSNVEDFVIRIPNHDVILLDFHRVRSLADGIGHMVCSECKLEWQNSTAGQGCPICRGNLQALHLPYDFNVLRTEGDSTSFHLYMLVRMVCLNMLAPENLNIDQRLADSVSRIISDYPRDDLISVRSYMSFLNEDSNYFISPLEVGMVFGHFGGACVDLDYMLFRRYTVQWGEHVMATIALRYLRSNNQSITFTIQHNEVQFAHRAYNLLYDIHIAGILGGHMNSMVDFDGLDTWFRHSIRDLTESEDEDDVFELEDVSTNSANQHQNQITNQVVQTATTVNANARIQTVITLGDDVIIGYLSDAEAGNNGSIDDRQEDAMD